MSEFIAAGAVLGGFGLLVLGFLLASSTVALLGVGAMFGVTGFFAFAKGSIARSWRHGMQNFHLLGRRERHAEHDEAESERNRAE